jgi:hypothetical protein
MNLYCVLELSILSDKFSICITTDTRSRSWSRMKSQTWPRDLPSVPIISLSMRLFSPESSPGLGRGDRCSPCGAGIRFWARATPFGTVPVRITIRLTVVNCAIRLVGNIVIIFFASGTGSTIPSLTRELRGIGKIGFSVALICRFHFFYGAAGGLSRRLLHFWMALSSPASLFGHDTLNVPMRIAAMS